MQLKMSVTTISAIALLFLGACSSGNQATDPASSPAATPAETQSSTAASPAASAMKPASGGSHGGQGGQVVESGSYHLELVTGKETSGTHLDLFLQKGEKHETVPNAKVTAQVQLPDGSQKSLAMIYDPAEKHYTAKLPNAAPGTYKVVILSDIGGNKVNGRFNFKQ